ncbi:DP-EP family protein [Pseudoalteromonas sp.]|uniref:DP-EP family protein n=1 Tax=Pseudoalteromonas sp. TaxID=53249 RepID=UPI0030010CF5
MTSTIKKADIQVHIELNNGKAIFSYTENGKVVDGGGIVRSEIAATYTLAQATIQQGFFFTGVTITDKVGTCAQDFIHKLSENRQAITITDTDENSGTACLIFHVECNDKPYSSPDPQVINERKN